MIIDNGPVAIYRQIIDYFQLELASGRIKPGEKIDSIRNLALQFKVNPNTVQKALKELERDGLMDTDRTNGKYATQDVEKIKNLKSSIAIEAVDQFIVSAKGLGLEKKTILELIEKEWETEHE